MGAGGAEEKPGARDGGGGAEGEDIELADGGIRSLETRVRQESSVSRSEARLNSGGIHVGGVRRGSHSDSAGGTAPRVRAAKSSELG